MLQDVKFYLGKCFPMKDLGEAAYILGIKIYRDRSNRLVGLYQSEYIEKILKRFKIENSKRGRSIMYAVVVKNILKYLMNTKYMFLVYVGDLDEELRVTCYTDDGYEIDVDDIKSQTCAIILANEPGIQKGAKHYKRKVHYLREVIADNDINLLKHTNDNIADPFTKALPCTKHTGHTRSIGLCLASNLM
ncbi:hypothetical protein Tco_0859819 [Tanacetum coccineum]|uniref:Reverse transcriptase Ty1/copia-type domain-containing protein n=1 Tax=Tanacetum coccineum TaxID=301880 RepID=A0ABQ5BGC2_9ASTR